MSKYTPFGDFSAEYTAYDSAAVVIVPAPYDGTSTWIKGADKGPAALLEASYNLEFYDIETDSEVFRKGIHTDQPIPAADTPEETVEQIHNRITIHLNNGKFPVLIGGEHSVSIGAIQAFQDAYPGIEVLQLDAHTDLRDEYLGSRCNHACVMARAREKSVIHQVGIRSMDAAEKPHLPVENIWYAKDIAPHAAETSWMDRAVERMGENLYLTIDLDVFDPSVLPATGTPEPGGLDWYQVIGFLRKVFAARNVVGFDIVELCPNPVEKRSDFLSAKLLYTLLSYRYCL